MSINKILYPCKFLGITSGYKTPTRPTHNGIDMGWNRNHGGPNHPLLAPFDGTVTDIKTDVIDGTGTSYGNYLILQSNYDKNFTILLGHIKNGSFKVKKGDKVMQGEELAKMGDTGNATGVHCHFEVRKNGTKVNPVLYAYANKDMEITKNTLDKYKILMLEETTFQKVPGVSRNPAVNQLQVINNELRVRKEPSLSADQVGWATLNTYYNFLDQTTVDGYTWYQIDVDKWLAYKDSWLRIYPKEVATNNKDEVIAQLQKEIIELEKQRNDLANEVISLQAENEELKAELAESLESLFKYDVTANGNYQIKLYQGETLCIK